MMKLLSSPPPLDDIFQMCSSVVVQHMMSKSVLDPEGF